MLKSILCYGDSNTYGYNPENGLRYGEDVRWTCVLQRLLGPEYRVIDEGCNGRTTVCDDPVEGWKNGLDYLKPCINSHKPVDLVVLMLGTNDLKNHFGLNARRIAENVGVLVDTIQEFSKEKQGFEPTIILVSPALIGEAIESSPFNNSFDITALERSKQFAEEYRSIAESKGCVFFDAASCTNVSPLDSVHFTKEDHLALAKALAEVIKTL